VINADGMRLARRLLASLMSIYPDIRQVRAFVSVAETNSFTKAAKALNLTQSAISHSVKSLEEQLGTCLIERSGKRLAITQDGKIYHKRCRKVISELDQAHREITNLKQWSQGRIRIGATHSMVKYILPSVLREFRESFPRCEVVVESGDSSSLIDKLDNAEIDYAFGMKSKYPSWCEYEKLFSDELGFVTCSAHPWAGEDLVEIDKLEKESFLVYGRSSETFRLIRQHVEKKGVKLRIAMTLDDMEAIKEMAKIGLGIGIVAPWVARSELDSGELSFVKCSEVDIKRDWGVYYHDMKKRNLPEAAFLGISRLVCAGLTSVASC